MSQLYQNALYGTVMILAAAVLRRALRDRLVPGARLALWAVCLFRLLTPAAPESVLSLWGLARLFATRKQSAPVPTAPVYVLAPGVSTPAPQSGPVISWETALLAAWLIVGAVLAARYVLAWIRTRRAVSCAIPLARDDPRYALLPKCARLREGPMEDAPLTFGAMRPTVVLSPGLDGTELDCVLVHEGVHAARRDNLWHYAMALALAVYWWNPAVWLMARLLRRDVELSCDRAALKKLGENRRADYANALVALATRAGGSAFCHTFGRKAAEERILSIMKFKKTSITGVIFSLTLVLAVTAAFASGPMEPDEDGNLVPMDPSTTAGGSYVLGDYVEEPADPASEGSAEFLLGEGNIQYDEGEVISDYTIGGATIVDENGVSRVYDEVGGLIIVGTRTEPVPSAAPDAMSAVYLENGYTLDANGNALVYDEDGNLFMKARYGYLPCILEDCCILKDCTVSATHCHVNGEVIFFPESNAPVPAFEPGAVTAPMQAPYCPVCTDTRLHLHVNGLTVPLADPCPVEGCTVLGNHIHDETVYSCNGAGHDGGVCDGSCYTYFN